jgi:hypothetical protein
MRNAGVAMEAYKWVMKAYTQISKEDLRGQAVCASVRITAGSL